MNSLTLFLLISILNLSTEKLRQPIEVIAKELKSRLIKQKLSQNSSFTISKEYLFNITNFSPIIFFPEHSYRDNDIHFDNVIVSFVFDLSILFSSLRAKPLYQMKQLFAEMRFTIHFTHEPIDNSYTDSLDTNSDSFKLSNNPLKDIPQLSSVYIEAIRQLRCNCAVLFEIFVRNQLQTYPYDDCAFVMETVLKMVINRRELKQVEIPLSTYTVTALKINSITYASYNREPFISCQIRKVVIDLNYYRGFTEFKEHKISIESVYLNNYSVSFEKVTTLIPPKLVAYIKKRFDDAAFECFKRD